MPDIAKKELIKDFILKDKERFSLAEDIYDNMKSIAEDMFREISKKQIEFINKRNNWDLTFSHVSSDDTWFKVNDCGMRVYVNPHIYLQFHSWYFFKTYEMVIRAAENGFDPQNEDHLQLRNRIKIEFSEIFFENSWVIAGLRNYDYELNIGGQYRDLFDVYKNENNLRTMLCENFESRFKTQIEKILSFL
ncbi:MAG: hypothetical protein SVO01_09395 [Thermotogota bacterium]|nr:hypothetical protein [Thermotogota bacterium]